MSFKDIVNRESGTLNPFTKVISWGSKTGKNETKKRQKSRKLLKSSRSYTANTLQHHIKRILSNNCKELNPRAFQQRVQRPHCCTIIVSYSDQYVGWVKPLKPLELEQKNCGFSTFANPKPVMLRSSPCLATSNRIITTQICVLLPEPCPLFQQSPHTGVSYGGRRPQPGPCGRFWPLRDSVYRPQPNP